MLLIANSLELTPVTSLCGEDLAFPGRVLKTKF